MKKTTTYLSTLFFASTVLAQNQAPVNPEHCGHTHQKEILYNNTHFKTTDSLEQNQFQSFYEDYLHHASSDERSTYVIPVVVHVVHLNGEENITNEQIYNAIDVLNLDYSASNTDLSNTVTDFQPIIGNADIEFRLATLDPNGDCHSGITRTYSNTTYDTGMTGSSSHPIVEAVAAEHGVWPQNKYMNLFVCIDPNGAAGYTLNPTNCTLPQGCMEVYL